MGIFDTLKRLVVIRDIMNSRKWDEGRRTHTIKVRVNDEELEAFKLLGKRMGVSALVRYAVLDIYLNSFIKDNS